MCDRDVHSDRLDADDERQPEHERQEDELGRERGELVEHEPSARDRVGEEQVERAPFLLAGGGAGAGADRGDQQQERHHEREQLAVQVADGGGVVDVLAEAEEGFEGVGVVVDHLVQLRVVAHGGVDGDHQRRHRDQAEAPPGDRAARVPERLQEGVTQHRAPRRGRG